MECSTKSGPALMRDMGSKTIPGGKWLPIAKKAAVHMPATFLAILQNFSTFSPCLDGAISVAPLPQSVESVHG
jgi:hypothetical protein